MPQAGRSPIDSVNRRIRVFVSSTFRDMIEERDALMTHAWPELRRFCRERQVELVEVDMRWGIPEEQSTRKETLKLCLDEIRACRPYFIGLLGERYGWVPGDDAFTADLKEEQPWLRDLQGRSVTELEILHGVLNNPEMAARSYFYFRDPAYAEGRGADYLPEDPASSARQAALKALIRRTCDAKQILLRDNYSDPRALAALVLEDLKVAIEAQFPLEEIPDPFTREARDHEAFAETRRRTYIGRPDYFEALDRHAVGEDGPLLLLGESGGGKSALLANWVAKWRTDHPGDFVFQHYIGSTPDSAEHWRLMARLIGEIKRWSEDPEDLPRSHDDILKTFPVWLAKARIRAEHEGVRFIVALDALNQLDEQDHARNLGWLPSHPFSGLLRLVVSTLPGETLDALKDRGWDTLRVEPLTADERRRMIAAYLKRFGKQLDTPRLNRLANATASANPLYLKIVLDELRVTGTHDRLDERLTDYLGATSIPALLRQVLERCQQDYERDRPGLVGEALGLIWAARRGLSESELLRLLRPDDRSQLPLATWAPLRAALEDGLVDRGGILNFSHDFLRAAVESAFVSGRDAVRKLRVRLADEFEGQPIHARSCDELPWLLWRAGERERLRACLLDIERFLIIRERNQEELMRYWVWLGEERTMGTPYLAAFATWSHEEWGDSADIPDPWTRGIRDARLSYAANQLATFFYFASLSVEAELLIRQALTIDERSSGSDSLAVGIRSNNLGALLKANHSLSEAEPLIRRALEIHEAVFGKDHPRVAFIMLNLAAVLHDQHKFHDGESLIRRALGIYERNLGLDDPAVAAGLSELATFLQDTRNPAEAEPLRRRALAIVESTLGRDHPDVARHLAGLAMLLRTTGRAAEAEPLIRRALAIDEMCFGADHPRFAEDVNALAHVLIAAHRWTEIGELSARLLAITATCTDPGCERHRALCSLALLLVDHDRTVEAEPLIVRALSICEQRPGEDNTSVAANMAILAELLRRTSRAVEAEPLIRRAFAIDEKCLGTGHRRFYDDAVELAYVLVAAERSEELTELTARLLAVTETCPGPDSPAFDALWRVASLLRADEAEPLMRRRLEIYERAHGADNPNTALFSSQLAEWLQKNNRPAEAEALWWHEIAIYEKHFGEVNICSARVLRKLALLHEASNRIAEAETLLRRSVALLESDVGSGQNIAEDDLLSGLTDLARLLQASNRHAEAEPLLRRILAIRERAPEPGLPEIVTVLSDLASVLCTIERQAEAVPLLRRVLAFYENRCGPNHPYVATALSNLAMVLGMTTHSEEAESVARRALMIHERSTNADGPEVGRALHVLARALQANGRNAEAEPLIRRAIAIYEQCLGADDPGVALCLNDAAILIQAAGGLAEAEPLMRRAVEVYLKSQGDNGHPHLRLAMKNYVALLRAMGRSPEQASAELQALSKPFGVRPEVDA